MKLVLKYSGEVSPEGKLRIYNKSGFDKQLLSITGRKVEITVREHKKNRTLDQNAWYWACVVGIPAAHFGYTPNEMHDAYKWMFLRKEGNGPTTVGSTAPLSTSEFSEYVERCLVFCAENELTIPTPEQLG